MKWPIETVKGNVASHMSPILCLGKTPVIKLGSTVQADDEMSPKQEAKT